MEEPDVESDASEPPEEKRPPTTSSPECACCGGADVGDYAGSVRPESESAVIPPDEGSTVLDADLPEGVREAAGRFLGVGSVATLGDWAEEMRRRTGGGSISVEDLCHERDPTGHWAELDGEEHHFTCFFDAVVLAALTDRRVAFGTESPGGTTIQGTVGGDGDLTVDPPGTLVSFGVATGPDAAPDGEPTPEDVYAAVCPVVKAFPTPDAYERWAADVPAATVAMRLEDATDLAAALAR